MIFNENLYSMTAQVRATKPNSNASQVAKDLNSRIRQLIDFRTSWSALITKSVINFPNAYSTGGITMTNGLTSISGTGTSWPVSDLVDTTMLTGNRSTGYVEITPASMDGINVDTLLTVQDSGYTEVVPVVEISPTTFTALFQYQHNDNTSLTCSSLAGRQIQISPLVAIYTLQGVVDATTTNNTGIIDMPFAGQTQTNTGYQLVQAYITLPNFRSWVQAWDPQQGIPIATSVSQSQIDAIDPQRTSQGWPQCIADLGPNSAGSFQQEVWPWQTSIYSIPVLYNHQWNELKKPTDRPPYFVNPSIFIDGAIADALRRKDIRSNTEADPYFNPVLAKDFDAKFLNGAIQAAKADDERCQLMLTSSTWQNGAISGSAAYDQSHVNTIGGLGGW